MVAIVSLVAPLDGVLRMFWSTSEHQSVAERAAQLSRISGVFNQPLEAGVAYSVGALMLVYLVTRGRLTRALRIAAAGLIVIGGVLPISKTFILVGLPIAAFVLLASRPGARRLGAAATMLVLAGVLAGVIGALPWQGSARLVDLLQPGDPEQNVVALYSAGRFGDEGTIGEVAAAIYQQAPVAGFGLADPGLVTDNAWVEIMSYGGVVALVIYTFAFLWWAALWWRNRSRTPAWWAGGGILAVVLIAGLGGPVLTLNRAGPLAVAAMVGFALPRRSQAGHLGPSDVPDRRASIVFAG